MTTVTVKGEEEGEEKPQFSSTTRTNIFNDNILSIPIHVVNHASQLPREFVEPSSERKLVIGFDCEGVDLCRSGTLCIMQWNSGDWLLLRWFFESSCSTT
ncbi:hypothetical protein ZOSMA_49G00040 [Zostera marina]|uniref:3'-5' exonuclease domain-containing protein n=1 Tax=Zostera marina TaxID=29655 RepID=A0A0K9NYP2_ZOSMR|nr:hypothetical protein ZOSMA_49G00040 [Zostera marina]